MIEIVTLIIQGHAVFNSIYRVLIDSWYHVVPTIPPRPLFSPSSSTLNLSADVLLCDHRPGLSTGSSMCYCPMVARNVISDAITD